MPTGYTAPIINGEITTFKDFAILCSRAFGATIHMREDGLKEEYRPREVSSYYSEYILRDMNKVKELKETDLVEYEATLIKKWTERIAYINNKIEETKKNFETLHNFLVEANNFAPPSTEHEEFKKFMISQLDSTIDYDGKIDYYLSELKDLSLTLESYSVEEELAKEIEMDGRFI